MSGYTALEIIGWLVVAGVVGFFVGWLVSLARRDEQLALEADFLEAKAATAEAKVEALRAKLANASPASEDLQPRLDQLLVDRETAASEALEFKKQLAERDAEVVGLRARLRAVEGRLQAAEELAAKAVESRDQARDALHERSQGGDDGPGLAGQREALFAATKAAEKATLDLAQAQLQTRALRDELEIHVSRLDNLANQLAEQSAVPASALIKGSDLHERLDALERGGGGPTCRADAVEAKLVELLEAASPPAVDPSPYVAASEETPQPAYVASPIGSSPPEAQPEPQSEPPSAPAEAAVDDAASRARAIAKRTAGEAPARNDDLEEVNGIGPKIEGLLKALGFTSFRQIAQLDADDIAVVGEALDVFPDRMTRDDWMGQAAALHAMKYGESLGEVDLDKISDAAIKAHAERIGQRTAAGRPVNDDDLKRVKGIGPKIEKLLKSLGITSFAQIARFEEKDVAFIGRALQTFTGRITRDEWMKKARALHQEVYDEDPMAE